MVTVILRVIILQQISYLPKPVEEYHSEYDFNPAVDFEESKDAVVCFESFISPTIVNKFNMGSVDAVNKDTEPYSPLRKSYSWSTKVALHLLHQMLLNSKDKYSNSHSKQMSMYKCTKLCCHGILAKYSEGYRKMKVNVKSSTFCMVW
ncbi:hypothetical protein JTB14_032815 [Gonioctena quinquepunctata]|nr:hypothetical protein JTB14_032815 [Gonioctena quinquepunctata]